MELWFTKEEEYETLIYNGEKQGNIPKQLKFLNNYIAVQLWFTMEKLWNYGNIYGTLEKKILYYGKKYDTIPKTIEFWFTMEQNLCTMGKNYL